MQSWKSKLVSSARCGHIYVCSAHVAAAGEDCRAPRIGNRDGFDYDYDYEIDTPSLHHEIAFLFKRHLKLHFKPELWSFYETFMAEDVQRNSIYRSLN